MCQFFSSVSNGKGKIFYLNNEQRREIKGSDLEPDSHTSIVQYYKNKGLLANKNTTEDKLNKWEYNPLTKELICDALNTIDDKASVQKIMNNLDFKTIVPELFIKCIIHPFEKTASQVTEKEILLLKQWASVRDSVRDSVGASVRASVGASVWDSVRDSVWDSVRDSVWDSVRDSVWDSVRDSVWAYTSSFFELKKWRYIDHKEGDNPFQSCIDLWESGLVPSFDGNIWRLRAGEKAKIVFEISKDDLQAFKFTSI